MLKRTRAATAVASAFCLLTSGCGPTGGSVSGTVTLDGNPLKGGVVTFYPVAGGPNAIGAVSQDGNFVVQIGNEMKIPPGEYVVTVEASESAPYQTQVSPPKPPPPPKRITPDKYASKDTTDLKVTVSPGTNTVPLELKSDKDSKSETGPKSESEKESKKEKEAKNEK